MATFLKALNFGVGCEKIKGVNCLSTGMWARQRWFMQKGKAILILSRKAVILVPIVSVYCYMGGIVLVNGSILKWARVS
jgi:hypothetical protein